VNIGEPASRGAGQGRALSIPNVTGGDKQHFATWAQDLEEVLPAATPASSIIFYGSQAVGGDINDNLTQCDDTARVEFLGFLVDIIREQVDPTALVQVNGIQGDFEFKVQRPSRFEAYCAGAQPGCRGQKVYWLFNNQVAFTGLANYNYAGTIEKVINPNASIPIVVVNPPWCERVLGGGAVRSAQSLSGSLSVTLTKWDVNRSFYVPATVAVTITLPLMAKCSPGDRITFLNTGSGGFALTINGNGSLINGASTFSVGSAQYSKATLETDAVSGWFQVA
jgi:hypothetical protein